MILELLDVVRDALTDTERRELEVWLLEHERAQVCHDGSS